MPLIIARNVLFYDTARAIAFGLTFGMVLALGAVRGACSARFIPSRPRDRPRPHLDQDQHPLRSH